MLVKFLPKTLFGRLLFLVLIFMVSAILLVRALYSFFIAYPLGEQLAKYTQVMSIFAEEVSLKNTPESMAPFIKNLAEKTGTMILLNDTQPTNPLPKLPLFKAWEQALLINSKNEITLSYETAPLQILWLHHANTPQYSIGLPFIQRMNINQFTVISLAVALFFSLFSAYVTAKYLNYPLKDLAQKAKLIGQEIDNVTFEINGPKEIQEVALAMNKMRIDLEQMIKKQTFLLSSISHDLRTPLSRLQIATSILSTNDHSFKAGIDADIAEINEVIHRFIETTRFNIEETELWQIGDLRPLIKETCAKYNMAKVNLYLELEATEPIRFKSMAMRRYLYNLINNALEHGGGNLIINMRTIGHKIVLSISDQGSGFALSPLELHSYSNLDSVNTSISGLGLRIVQLIAKIHAAELTLRNKPEGGAEVILTLNPYKQV